MIEVDCTELTADEQLALAGALNESLQGSGMALLKGRKIVLDDLSDSPLDERVVTATIANFVERRRDSAHYSVERSGDRIIVHSPDPLAAARGRKLNGLPPNLRQCPFCPFVTPYEEAYVVHMRSHGFGV